MDPTSRSAVTPPPPPPSRPPRGDAAPHNDVATQLLLDSIQQKEIGYLRRMLPADQQLISTRLPTPHMRVRALGEQLRYVQALGMGASCRIGNDTLDAFLARRADPLQRGVALLRALPEPPAPLPVRVQMLADMPYQALLSNACVGGDGLGEVTLVHAATFLTLATQPAPPTAAEPTDGRPPSR
jgi:hypothetical protein